MAGPVPAGLDRGPHRPPELIPAAASSLDAGEAAGVGLALELGADLLLIDEAAGRRVAAEAGPDVCGVLGVLLRAKAAGLIDRVAPAVLELRDGTTFHVSDALCARTIAAAGE